MSGQVARQVNKDLAVSKERMDHLVPPDVQETKETEDQPVSLVSMDWEALLVQPVHLEKMEPEERLEVLDPSAKLASKVPREQLVLMATPVPRERLVREVDLEKMVSKELEDLKVKVEIKEPQEPVATLVDRDQKVTKDSADLLV